MLGRGGGGVFSWLPSATSPLDATKILRTGPLIPARSRVNVHFTSSRQQKTEQNRMDQPLKTPHTPHTLTLTQPFASL